jgi:hypothetical protein
MNDADRQTCRCPVRPYYSPGSLGSGSTTETANLRRWEAEHGGHPYAKARDDLAGAMQTAESRVGSGEEVLQMAHEIMGAAFHPSSHDAATTTRDRNWMEVKPSEVPNILMNYLGQDPRYGYEHPLVKIALFRLREALARVSNSLDGYFG